METLSVVLPIIIDLLLIVLLVVGIILVIKCIYIIDKAKDVVLNIEEKVNSLNSLFSIVSLISDKVNGVTDKAISYIESLVLKIFKPKEESIEPEEEELESILEKERNE